MRYLAERVGALLPASLIVALAVSSVAVPHSWGHVDRRPDVEPEQVDPLTRALAYADRDCVPAGAPRPDAIPAGAVQQQGTEIVYRPLDAALAAAESDWWTLSLCYGTARP